MKCIDLNAGNALSVTGSEVKYILPILQAIITVGEGATDEGGRKEGCSSRWQWYNYNRAFLKKQ